MIPGAALDSSIYGYVVILAFCCCWEAVENFELTLPFWNLLGSMSSDFVGLKLEFGHKGNGISLWVMLAFAKVGAMFVSYSCFFNLF